MVLVLLFVLVLVLVIFGLTVITGLTVVFPPCGGVTTQAADEREQERPQLSTPITVWPQTKGVDALQLAGKHPPAGKRHRTRGHHGEWR